MLQSWRRSVAAALLSLGSIGHLQLSRRGRPRARTFARRMLGGHVLSSRQQRVYLRQRHVCSQRRAVGSSKQAFRPKLEPCRGVRLPNGGRQCQTGEPPPATEDEVFRWLALKLGRKLSADQHWGDVLDAGTGTDSLHWLASCPVQSITAVTASEKMRRTVHDEAGDFLDPAVDAVLLGNWCDSKFLEGRQFDAVVADYLLGAVEFFAPHFQLGLIRRLHELVRPGGWLLFAGKEPENLSAATKDPTARLVLEAEAVRDATMILGLKRTYREIPKWWVLEQLAEAGFEVHGYQAFPKRLTGAKVGRQLGWAKEELMNVQDPFLQASLRKQIESLRLKILASPALCNGYIFGEDYAIVAQRPIAAP